MNSGETGSYRSQGDSSQNGNQFERIVILYNPNASQADLALKYIDELSGSKFGDIMLEPIMTSTDRALEEKYLTDLLKEGDAVITFGGDGTSTRLLNPLLSDELAHLSIALLPVACGDSNDLPIMANGKSPSLPLSYILDSGNIVDVNPIDTSFIGPSGDEFSISAFSYIGFGNTALIANRLNERGYRDKTNGSNTSRRLVEQSKIILGQSPKSKLGVFSIRDELGARKVHEITVVNGSRMAKIGRFDLKLTDPTMLRLGYESGNFVKTVAWLGRLATGRLARSYMYEGDQYDFLLESDTLMHADAEVIQLEKHTFVRIKQHKRSVSIISTIL